MNKKLGSLIVTLVIILSTQLLGTTNALAEENLESNNLTTNAVTEKSNSETIDPEETVVNKETVQAPADKISDTKNSIPENVPSKATNTVTDDLNKDVLAKEVLSKSEPEVTTLPKKHNVFPNKSWKVVFSSPVNPYTVYDKIKIYEKSTNTQVKTSFEFIYNNKVVLVKLLDEYKEKEDYSLVIDKNIMSTYKRILKNPVVLDFDTDYKIVSVQPINDTANFLGDYTAPATTNITMSDGSTRTVAVNWSSAPDTFKEGLTSYVGTIDGAGNEAILNLNVNPIIANGYREQSGFQTDLVKYVLDNNNRESVYKRAVELHYGDSSNTCAYTASEALRRVGMTDLPNSVCNTVGLTNQLKSRNWITETDFSKMLPGDIAFTRSYGYGPTHTYTFIKWVKPDDYRYAYIFDNQRDENGSLYHIRNINFQTSEKDITTYFMHL